MLFLQPKGQFQDLASKMDSTDISSNSHQIIPEQTRKSIVGAFSQQKKNLKMIKNSMNK